MKRGPIIRAALRELVAILGLTFMIISASRGDVAWTVCFGVLLLLNAIERKR